MMGFVAVVVIAVVVGIIIGIAVGRRGSAEKTAAGADALVAKDVPPIVRAAATDSATAAEPKVSAPVQRPPAARAPRSIRIAVADVPVGSMVPFRGDRPLQAIKDDRVRRGIEAVIRAAPAMALSAGASSGRLVLLKLTPEAASRVASGELTYMAARTGGLRANLVDKGGTIRNQASFVEPGAAGQAAGAALAVWQVLAVVTAQKFLADIDRKLASIERGIGELRDFLEQEQIGKLNGNLAYMKRVAAELSARDVSESDLQAYVAQLESIERECHQIEAAIAAEMERHHSALEKMILQGEGFKEHVEEAHRAVAGFGRAAQVRLLLTFVRGVAAQLRAALPVSKAATLERVRSVADSVKASMENHGRFLELLERRIPELKGEWTYDSTDEREQAKLKVRFFEMKERLREGTTQLGSATKRLEKALLKQIEGRSGARFVASLDDEGKVVELSEAGPRKLLPEPD